MSRAGQLQTPPGPLLSSPPSQFQANLHYDPIFVGSSEPEAQGALPFHERGLVFTTDAPPHVPTTSQVRVTTLGTPSVPLRDGLCPSSNVDGTGQLQTAPASLLSSPSQCEANLHYNPVPVGSSEPETHGALPCHGNDLAFTTDLRRHVPLTSQFDTQKAQAAALRMPSFPLREGSIPIPDADGTGQLQTPPSSLLPSPSSQCEANSHYNGIPAELFQSETYTQPSYEQEFVFEGDAPLHVFAASQFETHTQAIALGMSSVPSMEGLLPSSNVDGTEMRRTPPNSLPSSSSQYETNSHYNPAHVSSSQSQMLPSPFNEQSAVYTYDVSFPASRNMQCSPFGVDEPPYCTASPTSFSSREGSVPNTDTDRFSRLDGSLQTRSTFPVNSLSQETTKYPIQVEGLSQSPTFPAYYSSDPIHPPHHDYGATSHPLALFNGFEESTTTVSQPSSGPVPASPRENPHLVSVPPPKTKWYICRCSTAGSPCEVLMGNTTSSVRYHLKMFHNFKGNNKTEFICPWEDCMANLQKENIPRHIVARHLKEKVPCQTCGREFSRNDVLRNHARSCHGRRSL